MTKLTADTLRSPADCRPLSPVDVPELGGRLYVRRMSVGESLDLSKAEDEKANVVAILSSIVCYEDGTPVWSGDSAAQLLEYPMAALQPLMDAHIAMNVVSVRGIEDRKEKSGSAPESEHSSGSPSASTE